MVVAILSICHVQARVLEREIGVMDVVKCVASEFGRRLTTHPLISLSGLGLCQKINRDVEEARPCDFPGQSSDPGAREEDVVD